MDLKVVSTQGDCSMKSGRFLIIIPRSVQLFWETLCRYKINVYLCHQVPLNVSVRQTFPERREAV